MDSKNRLPINIWFILLVTIHIEIKILNRLRVFSRYLIRACVCNIIFAISIVQTYVSFYITISLYYVHNGNACALIHFVTEKLRGKKSGS